MQVAIFAFVALLLFAAFLCVLFIRRGITDSIYEERRRKLDEWNALVVRKRQMERHRRKVWSTIEIAFIKYKEKTSKLELPLSAQDRKGRKRTDPWVTTSQINAAFDQFMHRKPQKAMSAHAASFHQDRQHQSL